MKHQILPTQLLECYAPDGRPRRVSPEQLAAGRQHMEKAFLRLIAVSDRDNYYWVGLHTDLLEIIYLVFLDNLVRDAQGTPLPLARLIEHTYAVLHMCVPANPYSLIRRARRRKGVRRTTMLQRYCWRLYVEGVTDPLADEVICLSK